MPFAPSPRSILITGASSGIGAALALFYAEKGTCLFLSGRNPERLEDTLKACRAQGAKAEGQSLDISDGLACRTWIESCHKKHPLDLVIANAGISSGRGGKGESCENMHAIFEVNVMGVVHTALAAIPLMREKKSGQIALVSSIAGFLGPLGYAAPAYCASKAAERIWGESLRPMLYPAGIHINVICPGFVRSRMTATNDFPMPFLMDGEKAARIIAKGLARDKARIIFPWQMAVLVRTLDFFLALLPAAAADSLVRRLGGAPPTTP